MYRTEEKSKRCSIFPVKSKQERVINHYDFFRNSEFLHIPLAWDKIFVNKISFVSENCLEMFSFWHNYSFHILKIQNQPYLNFCLPVGNAFLFTFNEKTCPPFAMIPFLLLYLCKRWLYATWNYHTTFENKITAAHTLKSRYGRYFVRFSQWTGQFPMELSVVIPNLREAVICHLEMSYAFWK